MCSPPRPVGLASVFAVWALVGGLSDNFLKPILLGRGMDVPMPVILIGVIGGMIADGLIGLFVGPVVLAIGLGAVHRVAGRARRPA
jgi:predicted PurR-regulated permease PerM